MPLRNTTPTPNEFFVHIPDLTDHEIRFLLLVIRQTWGWQKSDKSRKQKDRMTHGYISKRTGLYRACLSTTIQSLINKQLLLVTDEDGKIMNTPFKRKGKRFLYYEYVRREHISNPDTTYLQLQTRHVCNSEHNKRNTIQKKMEQKEFRRYKRYIEEL